MCQIATQNLNSNCSTKNEKLKNDWQKGKQEAGEYGLTRVTEYIQVCIQNIEYIEVCTLPFIHAAFCIQVCIQNIEYIEVCTLHFIHAAFCIHVCIQNIEYIEVCTLPFIHAAFCIHVLFRI